MSAPDPSAAPPRRRPSPPAAAPRAGRLRRAGPAGGRLAAGLVLAGLLAACSTVPFTGRSQLRFIPLDQELSLGAQAYDETLGQSKVIKTGKDAEMVARVGQRIADSAKRLFPDPALEFDWQIVLLDEPKTVNAWCLPGGKMAVYSGLLPVTQDEDTLAIVVGHEVAHAIARHGSERMSQELIMTAGVTAAGLSMKDMNPQERDMLLAALVGVGTYGALLPYSRLHESEADEIGLMMAADAGYDPRTAIPLWERMAAAGGAKPPELLSTHPSDQTRIENLKSLMPQALEYYQAAKKAGR